MTAAPAPATRRDRRTDGGIPSDPGLALPSPLVGRVAAALAEHRIRHCVWPEREPGFHDLGLLVDRAHSIRLATALGQLGFKPTMPSPAEPGVVTYLAPDSWSDRLMRLRVHHSALVEAARGVSYRLPIAHAVLQTAHAHEPFGAPAPGFAMLACLIRCTGRHAVRELVGGPPRWLVEIQPALERFERARPGLAVGTLLARHVPDADAGLAAHWRDALRLDAAPAQRLAARRSLNRTLAAYRVRRPLGLRLRSLLRPGDTRRRLLTGGAIVGIVGTDGAGKSTCARVLARWLDAELAVRATHLGKPRRSLLTLLVGGAYKLSRALDRRDRGPSRRTAHLELARYVATGRDRWLAYRRAHRFAAGGGVALCDRYPIPECYGHAGPSAAQDQAMAAQSRLAVRLRRLEMQYYAAIPAPDILIVLEVDADTAVARKTDEPAAYVRARAERMRTRDWSRYRAIVVDTSAPLNRVLAELRYRLWEWL